MSYLAQFTEQLITFQLSHLETKGASFLQLMHIY